MSSRPFRLVALTAAVAAAGAWMVARVAPAGLARVVARLSKPNDSDDAAGMWHIRYCWRTRRARRDFALSAPGWQRGCSHVSCCSARKEAR